MIHGEADAYIRPEMAASLFDKAGSKVKEYWPVPGAKHNQALTVAGADYARKLTVFLYGHLAPFAEPVPESAVAVDPTLTGLAAAGAD
jgi:fermentation-respiration switch protein FrsA (DUF1100 family)